MNEYIDKTDLSLFQKANTHPFFHCKRKIDLPAVVIKKKYFNHPLTQTKCHQRYNVTLFFQGRWQRSRYQSMTVENTKTEYYSKNPMDIITSCPRCAVRHSLQNAQAESESIIISIEDNSDSFRFKGNEHDAMLLKSHFCLILPGNQQRTYR